MSREPIDLGLGHTLTFTIWSPDRELNPRYAHLPDLDPSGAIVDHPWAGTSQPRCSGFVTFEPSEAHLVALQAAGNDEWQVFWGVLSLDPLTLIPSILCRRCGDHGFIRENRWVPA